MRAAALALVLAGCSAVDSGRQAADAVREFAAAATPAVEAVRELAVESKPVATEVRALVSEVRARIAPEAPPDGSALSLLAWAARNPWQALGAVAAFLASLGLVWRRVQTIRGALADVIRAVEDAPPEAAEAVKARAAAIMPTGHRTIVRRVKRSVVH